MDPNALAGQITSLDNSYNPTDVYNRITSSLGIPDARARVTALQKNLVDTQNAIDAVDPSVTGRTQNSVVTEAQRSRLVNMEKQPLNETYTKQNQSYGIEGTNLNNLLGQADKQAANEQSAYTVKRQSLATMLDTALKEQAAAEQKREFDAQMAAQAAARNSGGGGRSGGGGSGGSGGAQVNPAQDFLNYIANQMKAAGGQGNPKISRQTQDAWANSWFAQNNVSNANRQQYWDLYNKTYNRVSDPTKDWRWAR